MDKLQIIVIDSHGVSRAACCALFRTEGVDVIADFGWRDGAITAALALAPDVVIVDVTPGHESHAHLRRLREVEEGPLIVLTSSVPHDDFLEQLEGFHFIAKADLCATQIVDTVAKARSKEPS